jgi:F-type H+-transporting ATPase subunit epsilon
VKIEIVTPKGQAWIGDAEEVTAPGKIGELGVLPGHVPLLAALKAGVLRLRRGSGLTAFAVGPGYIEVAGDRVIILTDMCQGPSEIDLPLARKEYEAAVAVLAKWDRDIDAEWYELVARRDWADARVEVVTGEYRNGGIGAREAPNLPESPPNPAF